MNENNLNSTTQQDDAQVDGTMIDYKKLLTMAVANWRWFVVSMVTCVLAACVYLLFVPSTVTVSGKMELLVKSNQGSGMSAALAKLNDLPMGIGSSIAGGAGAGSIDAEKEIILSNTLVTNVVKDLKLYTEYRLSSWMHKTLLYPNNPIDVSLDDAHLAWLDTELPLYYHQIKLTISKDDDGYTVEPTLIDGGAETNLPAQTFAQLPAVVKTESGTLTIKANSLPEKLANAYNGDYTLEVTITPPTLVANSFIARSSFEAASKKVSNLANLTVTDENLMRGIDYVSHLVEAYNKRANDEKNEEALKTDEFVNARLAKIDAELGSSDAAWENSKKNFQITEPESDAQEALAKKSGYEAQLVSISTELQLHDYLSDYINDPANLYEIIPSGLAGSSSAASSSKGSSSASSGSGYSSLISQHNALVNERKDLLKSVSEMSPQVQRLNEAIKDLHPTLKLAMKRDRQQLMMQKSVVEREFARYSGRIGSAPKMERVLTEIGRQREIKQGVYLLMLQKREEVAMELANVTDKGKLVDPPAAVAFTGASQKKPVLFAALLVGALLPAGVLYLLLMFKTRIDARDELEAVTNLPILAEIDTHNADDAIRNLRTHLLLNLKDGQKAILVASNSRGDGKTFIAKKLEESLSAIGKKVVLINANLRDNNCQLSMVNGQFGKCSHPSDVLASADFAQQMSDAKASNDYVIIDSPALNEYSDGYQLATFADATLYVVKAGMARKSDIEALNSNNNIPNPLIVFNV